MFAPISREGSLVLNNLFLTTAAATVLIGTLYPLLLEAVTGTKISVGAPFFNLTFGPLMVPLLMAVPFGPLLAWKRGDLAGAASRLYFAIGASLLVGLGVVFMQTGAPVLAGLGIALGMFLIFGALTDLALRAGIGRVSPSVAWSRLSGLPRSAFGSASVTHGLGVTVSAVSAGLWLSVYTETVWYRLESPALHHHGRRLRASISTASVPVMDGRTTPSPSNSRLSRGRRGRNTIASAKALLPRRAACPPRNRNSLNLRRQPSSTSRLGDPESNPACCVRGSVELRSPSIWFTAPCWMIAIGGCCRCPTAVCGSAPKPCVPRQKPAVKPAEAAA